MGLQESNNEFINLEEDQKYKPKTEPQIGDKEYAKWLTDRYNKKCAEVNELRIKLKIVTEKIKLLRKAADTKRLKYMNEVKEFSPQLMKDATIQRYKREIDNQNKAIKRLRNSIDTLVAENNKLKNK